MIDSHRKCRNRASDGTCQRDKREAIVRTIALRDRGIRRATEWRTQNGGSNDATGARSNTLVDCDACRRHRVGDVVDDGDVADHVIAGARDGSIALIDRGDQLVRRGDGGYRQADIWVQRARRIDDACSGPTRDCSNSGARDSLGRDVILDGDIAGNFLSAGSGSATRPTDGVTGIALADRGRDWLSTCYSTQRKRNPGQNRNEQCAS